MVANALYVEDVIAEVLVASDSVLARLHMSAFEALVTIKEFQPAVTARISAADHISLGLELGLG